MKIKFAKHDPRGGFVADVDDSRAEQFIESGCAVAFDDKAEAKSVEAAPENKAVNKAPQNKAKKGEK